MRTCDWWWGSHACDLMDGHEGAHRCNDGPNGHACSEFDGSRVRFADSNEWLPATGGRISDLPVMRFTENLK